MTTSPEATILVVEDDPGIAELERARLEEAGYRVMVAGTAEDALREVAREPVDLILLDYRLPGAENGLDFYTRVRAAGCDVPVILVTGCSDEAVVIRALRAGVRDFVTKSVEYLDYLPEAVGRVLRQVRTERRLAESEARLAGVIGSAKDAIIVADADRTITLFNPAAERMFGCPAAAAVGRPVTDFIPDELAPPPGGEDGPDAHTVSHRLRAGTRGVRADGREFPLEASVSRGRANGRQFFTIVVRDVTERRRAEQALRASEQRFRAVFDQAAVGMVLVAPDETLVGANSGFCRLVGHTPDEIPGLTIAAVSHPEDYHRHRHLLEEVRAGVRDSLSVEKRYVRKDGSVVWGDVTASVIRSPNGEIEYWVAIVQDITERRRAEDQVREQAALLDRAHDAIKVEDLDGRLRYWNRGAERLYGWTAEQVLGRAAEPLLYPNSLGERREALRRVHADGEWAGELRQVTKAGKEVLTRGSWSLLRDPAGEPTGVLMICTDVTGQKRLEEQLRQAQKMEVVGRLAGGIAHDFNNLLTVINGFGDLVLDQLPAGDPVRGMVEEVRRAGDRAAGLTRQLLAFSRQQVLEPKVLDLNEVVRDAERMLARLIEADITLTAALAPAPVRVKADAGQLEQVLLNLVVNARDAMPRGGRLTVETAAAELDEAYARTHPGVRPGRYALLSVSDTGVGMTPEVRERIFEPFFTTKEPGKGTGLGLSTVWGIVKQSGGHVDVYSEPGRGTAFKVYLPAATEAAEAIPQHPVFRDGPRGSETILLAEDEAAVRQLARLTLRSAGYQVLEASRPEGAVEIARRHPGPIDLLVTDVVMPGMGGRELADRVVALRPGVKVLYLSGYTDDAVVRHGVLQAEVAFLQKPFAIRALTQKVREVLGG